MTQRYKSIHMYKCMLVPYERWCEKEIKNLIDRTSLSAGEYLHEMYSFVCLTFCNQHCNWYFTKRALHNEKKDYAHKIWVCILNFTTCVCMLCIAAWLIESVALFILSSIIYFSKNVRLLVARLDILSSFFSSITSIRVCRCFDIK